MTRVSDQFIVCVFTLKSSFTTQEANPPRVTLALGGVPVWGGAKMWVGYKGGAGQKCRAEQKCGAGQSKSVGQG